MTIKAQIVAVISYLLVIEMRVIEKAVDYHNISLCAFVVSRSFTASRPVRRSGP
jgi:hypothetical protein